MSMGLPHTLRIRTCLLRHTPPPGKQPASLLYKPLTCHDGHHANQVVKGCAP